MKRILFLLVSAFLATTSYCASASEKLSLVISSTSSETQINEQQNEPLILQKSNESINSQFGHSSHCSHSSHSSHSSHYSSSY